MSIVPASALSAADLLALGNNLVVRAARRPTPRSAPPPPPPSRPRPRGILSAVNRSLAAHGEAVATLYRRPWVPAVARPRAVPAAALAGASRACPPQEYGPRP